MHAEKSRYSSVFFLACARARVVFTFLSTESFESGGVLGKAAKRLKGSRRFQWGMTSGRREGGREGPSEEKNHLSAVLVFQPKAFTHATEQS